MLYIVETFKNKTAIILFISWNIKNSKIWRIRCITAFLDFCSLGTLFDEFNGWDISFWFNTSNVYSNVHNFLSTWDSNINLYLSLIAYFSCKLKPRIHFELHWAVKIVKVEEKRSVKCIGRKNQMNAFSCSIHFGIIYSIFKKLSKAFTVLKIAVSFFS